MGEIRKHDNPAALFSGLESVAESCGMADKLHGSKYYNIASEASKKQSGDVVPFVINALKNGGMWANLIGFFFPGK